MYSFAGWRLSHLAPRYFETESAFARGFESRMQNIIAGRTVYLEDYWDAPRPGDEVLTSLRDPIYQEWKLAHYGGLDTSFRDYCVQKGVPLCL